MWDLRTPVAGAAAKKKSEQEKVDPRRFRSKTLPVKRRALLAEKKNVFVFASTPVWL